jgi:hypothetical protein
MPRNRCIEEFFARCVRHGRAVRSSAATKRLPPRLHRTKLARIGETVEIKNNT